MHLINCKDKVFTKNELIHANKAAEREKRNKQLREDFLESLSDEVYFPIYLAFEHSKGEIRVQIIFDGTGTTGLLDMSKKRYDDLPIATKNKEGKVELKYMNGKPYPDDREYTDKEVRKIVRDTSFRKKVLSAYDNQCAMCEINDISTLKAAHIYPAHLCGDDTVNNGICLCSNHDSAYESGVICVNSDGEITNYSESIGVSYSKIRKPKNNRDYPSPERLEQKFKDSMAKRRIR